MGKVGQGGVQCLQTPHLTGYTGWRRALKVSPLRRSVLTSNHCGSTCPVQVQPGIESRTISVVILDEAQTTLAIAWPALTRLHSAQDCMTVGAGCALDPGLLCVDVAHKSTAWRLCRCSLPVFVVVWFVLFQPSWQQLQDLAVCIVTPILLRLMDFPALHRSRHWTAWTIAVFK